MKRHSAVAKDVCAADAQQQHARLPSCGTLTSPKQHHRCLEVRVGARARRPSSRCLCDRPHAPRTRPRSPSRRVPTKPQQHTSATYPSECYLPKDVVDEVHDAKAAC